MYCSKPAYKRHIARFYFLDFNKQMLKEYFAKAKR